VRAAAKVWRVSKTTAARWVAMGNVLVCLQKRMFGMKVVS